ncbi:MAG: extracellular solute-binding protein [Saccharofermentans sp.]|nr:extracellular solute-binding protein [Saccharofermentans sp.]
MKKQSPKLVAGVLAVSMALSVAACTKTGGQSKGHAGKKITNDMPWFDAKAIELDRGIDESKDLEYSYTEIIGCDEKNIVAYTMGSYKMPDNVDWSTVDYRDYQVATASVYNRQTGETKVVDLSEVVSDSDYIESANFKDGVLSAMISTFDENTYEMTYKQIDFDFETKEILDTKTRDSGGQIEKTCEINGYLIEIENNWNQEYTSYVMYITSPDGERRTVDFKSENKNMYLFSSPIPLSDTEILVATDTDTDWECYTIDLTTGQKTTADKKDYDWMDQTVFYNSFLGSDGIPYYTLPSGVFKIDVKNKTTEEVFNYSWCGVNRNILMNLSVADIDEDSFILYGTQYVQSAFRQIYTSMDADFSIYEFTKADKNPHAGKTILELYSSYGYLEDKISDVIAKYNENSTDYFIEVSSRYSKMITYDSTNIESEDDMEMASLNYSTDVTNKLAMDIINGEGPDMFMDINYYGQLNNETYLADLSPYVEKLSSDKYFTNVIEASKVDGKLFNLPVCFSLEGIQTDSANAGASGTGFTTDEYIRFLDKTLNGKDIISSGQKYYFVTLFNNMQEKFISNGKADFSAPEFKVLADYVKDNVQEQNTDWDEMYNVSYVYDGSEPKETEPAVYSSCYSYFNYFQSVENTNGATAVLGIPSADGRGPMVGAYTSVAISAQATNKDACGEFVKMLLSDEVQKDMAMSGIFVLNREAFKNAGKEAVAVFNKEGLEPDYGYYDAYSQPNNRVKFTEEQLDELENAILTCSKMSSEDAAISLILIEEMPAYFSGQKDLDSVVKIAQDRVQKVLDERK